MNRRLFPAVAVALVLGALAAAVPAAEIQVTVTNRSGRPAPDVVVLLRPTRATAAPLPSGTVIVQKDNRFEPYVTAIPVGTRVRFDNQDRYAHHVRSLGTGPMGAVPPAKSFELRLEGVQQGPQASADMLFDAAGSVVLGCHIHGSMRGHVFIADTPWVAVTDTYGRATLAGLPDGPAELQLWHPDQLSGQAAQTVQLAPGSTAEARLSFNPPRRPAPRPKSEYDFN